jgi:hypothetical protein
MKFFVYNTSWRCVLKLVEVLELYRTFSVGDFKYSGASPVIKADGFSSQDYVLVIRKQQVGEICLRRFKEFAAGKAFRTAEDKKYLTIQCL